MGDSTAAAAAAATLSSLCSSHSSMSTVPRNTEVRAYPHAVPTRVQGPEGSTRFRESATNSTTNTPHLARYSNAMQRCIIRSTRVALIGTKPVVQAYHLRAFRGHNRLLKGVQFVYDIKVVFRQLPYIVSILTVHTASEFENGTSSRLTQL